MKTIVKSIFSIVAVLLTVAACQQPTYNELGALPSASDLDIVVECDQDINVVTFTCNNSGMLPVWHFEDGTISTSTIVERFYANAGTYSIEVYAMDANGMSKEPQIAEFTINSDYTSPEMQAMIDALCGDGDAKSWVWNSSVDGHFGCGPSGSATGNDWFYATADSQSEEGMYDDVMTFSSTGEYSYSPGDDGLLYVNEGVTLSDFTQYKPADSEAAYSAEVDPTSGTWAISSDGTNIYIKLSSGMLAGYMPFDELYTNPTFKVATLEENLLVMIADNGGIAWRFEFIPAAE